MLNLTTTIPGRLPFAIAVGGIVVPAVVTLFWMLADDLGPRRALATPFPYLFFAVMWVLVIPVYLAGRSWFGIALTRLAAAGLLLALPPIVLAWSIFLPDRAMLITALTIGATSVGAVTFWACLRLLAPRR